MANVSASKKLKKFVDISLAFTPNPVTGDLAVLKDERAINNAIRNVVLTIPGEVPFRRDVGSTVTDYLFDLVDEGTAGLLMLEIRRAIAFSEPRAEDVEVFVEAQPQEHQFYVRVEYKIAGYDQVFVFEQILRPTRY